MKSLFVKRSVLFFVLIILLAGCGGDSEASFSTANIQSAVLAKDEEGSQETTTFAADDTFYLIAELANAPDDTTVKTSWYAVDVGSTVEPNYLIDEGNLTFGSGTLTFNLDPESNWLPGKYKVEIYLNDELEKTLTFEVEGEIVEAAGGLLTGIDNIRDAVVQIEIVGSFVPPEIGENVTTLGFGSGFIIDPSGIAVTNHHVVTGAALVKVHLAGESEPRNAKVLGVSECNDLAVIDIDGDGFSYLDWYEDEMKVGLNMFIAGFPLGEPEYSLTSGIISKVSGSGSTYWSDVDSVLVYDATGNPGNSGGPVVDENGRVIAVHYRGRSSARQAFGIAANYAQPIIEQLRQGSNVHAIGINGEAVSDDDGSLNGIWVSSVESGSIADTTGIRPGDILTKLEGVPMATDGTMADYCDILRSRNPEDVISIEVLRFNSGQLLEGQLNGRLLEPITVASNSGANQQENNNDQAAGGNTGNTGSAGNTGSSGNSGSAAGYADYVNINDDSGQMTLAVPTAWSQVDGAAWTNSDGEVIGIRVAASSDLNGFLGTWSVPGVIFKAGSDLGVTSQQLLDSSDLSESCEYGSREDYADEVYTGQYDIWNNCGGEGTTFVVLSAAPADNAYLVVLEIQIISDADVEAFDNVLASFIVNAQ